MILQFMTEPTPVALLIRIRRSQLILPHLKATNRKIGDGPKENIKKKSLHPISAKKLETIMSEGSLVWMLAAREVREDFKIDYPKEVASLLSEFHDVFPEDLSDYLPSMKNIQHAIDLAHGSTLPNLPHYRLNPTEHAKLQRQVRELINKDS